MLQEGRDADLKALPWQPGHEPPRSPEEVARLVREAEARKRARDREAYDRFGPERPGVRCREAGCQRGAVAHSTLCRPHHFENVVSRPCPFDD